MQHANNPNTLRPSEVSHFRLGCSYSQLKGSLHLVLVAQLHLSH